MNLRQVEAFRAVIENGTVSSAAEALNVTQPAVSKLVSNLESDTGLRLFDRAKGKLSPTVHGMRLYEEVDRIFAGLHQLERAVESVKREERGHLLIGVLPALSGRFIQRATTRFMQREKGVFVSLVVKGSPGLADWLVTRQIDVGILNARVEHPYLEAVPFLPEKIVCILPIGHPLSDRKMIRPEDLHGQDFVAFDKTVELRRATDAVMLEHGVRPNLVLEASTAPTVCEFVAGGIGISLVHPLMAETVQGRVVTRRFTPELVNHFLLARTQKARNAGLLNSFVACANEVGAEIMGDMFSG